MPFFNVHFIHQRRKKLSNLLCCPSVVKTTADHEGTKGSSHIYQKNILMITKTFGKNILWIAETTTELFVRFQSHYTWHKTNTFHKKNIIPTGKHGGVSVEVWCCSLAGKTVTRIRRQLVFHTGPDRLDRFFSPLIDELII